MYTVSEEVGSLSVCIQLVGGNLSQQVNVTIQSQDGTATGKIDSFPFVSMIHDSRANFFMVSILAVQ